MTEPFRARPGGAAVAEVAAGLRVLVVDDDRTVREGCVSVLQLDGHQVTATARGDEALELLRRRRYDLVLVELALAPVGGLELVRTAVAAHPGVLVVAMSGDSSVVGSIEALRTGAWDYLPKPFSASQLQVLANSSHSLRVDVPEAMRAAIAEFVTDAAPRG